MLGIDSGFARKGHSNKPTSFPGQAWEIYASLIIDGPEDPASIC